jgi:hypothetical protein
MNLIDWQDDHLTFRQMIGLPRDGYLGFTTKILTITSNDAVKSNQLR